LVLPTQIETSQQKPSRSVCQFENRLDGFTSLKIDRLKARVFYLSLPPFLFAFENDKYLPRPSDILLAT